jgi:uncharacterized membrane protein
MGSTAAGLGGGLYVLFAIFVIVMTICWIVLPFAIIGTKSLLRQILAEQRRTNELLAQRAQRSQGSEPTL